jgi:hyaluronoglucosaminidase
MSGFTQVASLFFSVWLVVLCSCSSGVGPAGNDVEVVDSVAEVADLGEEVAAEPFQACQGVALEGPAGHLLPQPAQAFSFDTPQVLTSTAVGWSGPFEGLEGELAALAEARGLTVSNGDLALEIVFHSESVWADVLVSCGGSGSVAESYFLRVKVADGRAIAEIAASDDAGRFYALKTLRQLLVPGEFLAIHPATIYDRPATATRGILEGYYGQPWEPADRLSMVVESAHLKFNTYVYAPKGAATINTAWMIPFEKQELDHFAKLAEVARENHVRVCFEIHPSFLFHYSTQSDFDILLAKFEAVVDVGIDCLVLAYDDVPPELVPPDDEVFGSYTDAQMDFVPRLGEALLANHPDLQLAFVPVEYFTLHEDAESAWPAFGEALQQQWQIAWTGQHIGSPTVTLEDAEEATALMGRKPLLGDNYPVSDDAYKTGIVHLGPLRGRDRDLVDSLSGLAFNAMPLPYASLPALATCGDYSWNPGGYDPDLSASNSARLYAGESGEAGLLTLMMANRSPMLDGSHAPDLENAVTAFWEAWESEVDVAIAATLLRTQFFDSYLGITDAMLGEAAQADVTAQLLPWAEALEAHGAAGGLAVSLLEARLQGETVEVTSLEAALTDLKAHVAKPAGGQLVGFLERALQELE